MGLIPSMFLRCNSYLRAVLDVFGQALQQLLKEEESNKEHEEEHDGPPNVTPNSSPLRPQER